MICSKKKVFIIACGVHSVSILVAHLQISFFRLLLEAVALRYSAMDSADNQLDSRVSVGMSMMSPSPCSCRDLSNFGMNQ